jgi:hypothetical protein
MKLQTIKVEGEQTEKFHDSFEDYSLYPMGTKRIILSYSLSPKTLNDDKRRGLQVIEQEAGIETTASIEGAINSNVWRDLTYLGNPAISAIKIINFLKKNKIDKRDIKATINDPFFEFDSQLITRLLE